MCQGSLSSEQVPHERCMRADILQQRGTVGHMETTVMPNPHHQDLLCQVSYTALLAAQQQPSSQRQSCRAMRLRTKGAQRSAGAAAGAQPGVGVRASSCTPMRPLRR